MKRHFTRNLSRLGLGVAVLISISVGVFTTVTLRALVDSNTTIRHTLRSWTHLEKPSPCLPTSNPINAVNCHG